VIWTKPGTRVKLLILKGALLGRQPKLSFSFLFIVLIFEISFCCFKKTEKMREKIYILIGEKI